MLRAMDLRLDLFGLMDYFGPNEITGEILIKIRFYASLTLLYKLGFEEYFEVPHMICPICKYKDWEGPHMNTFGPEEHEEDCEMFRIVNQIYDHYMVNNYIATNHRLGRLEEEG